MKAEKKRNYNQITSKKTRSCMYAKEGRNWLMSSATEYATSSKMREKSLKIRTITHTRSTARLGAGCLVQENEETFTGMRSKTSSISTWSWDYKAASSSVCS